jgi:phage terminase large subunit-like protein
MPTATPSTRTARSRAAGRRPEHPVTRYARAVEAGRIVAGPYIRAACDRHLRDLERPELDFDEVAANKALDFFPELLRLTGEGQFAGQPFRLQPWQQFIVGSLFG